MMEDSQPRFVKIYDFFDGNLFPEDYNLVIPTYQRGYKWAVKELDNPEAESSVEYFVKSIIESFHANSELFLQGITVSDSQSDVSIKRDVVIIDGQQRLTTLYLLLWCLDKELIQQTSIRYDARKDTDICLNKLKQIDCDVENHSIGDIYKQDIYFINEAISQIRTLIKNVGERKIDLIKYIKEKIKVIYIPIASKEDAVSTFTMMNGSKAIMRAEELIKSELLRLVSKTCQDFSFEAASVEEVLVRLRDFTAMDWNTAEIRSRYAREWDRWLYWWNRPEVKTFYRTTTETRPLGLLLDYYYRNSDSQNSSYSSFKQFQSRHLKDNHGTESIAHNIFRQLRQLQKKFEDVFNDNFTYNMLSMTLSCWSDRYKAITFFLDHLNDENRKEVLRRYTEGSMIDLKHTAAVEYALKIKKDEDIEGFNVKKSSFIDNLLSENVYEESNVEYAYRYLAYRNILESNKLNERFNIGILIGRNRSLEHIHPKSKVYHIDDASGKLMRGDNNLVEPESMGFPTPMPDGYIKRDDIRSDNDKVILSEHSICNLVLLYGGDNSEFGKKDFEEKKEIFFRVAHQEKIFISRTLQHTLSKFANVKWEVNDMIEYYMETKNYLENDFLS